MKIWLLSDHDHGKHLAFKGLLARFTAAFPDAAPEFSVKSRGSLWESLFAHLRDPKRNPLADVLELPQHWTELFSRLGLLADLAARAEADRLRRCPAFILKELYRHDEARLFSAPWWLEAPALYYRPRAAEGALRDPRAELASWDGFRAALDRLPQGRRRGGSALAAPYSSGAVSPADVLPRVWGRRGGLFSDDFNRATFTRSETAGGIEDWLELAVSGKVELFSPDRFENGTRPSEHAAFVFSPRKLRGSGQGELRLLPYPGCAAGGGLVLINNLAVSSSSQDQAGACAFVSWALQPENLGPFTEAFGVFPCAKAVFEQRLQEEREAGVYRQIFTGPELMPNIMAYPTAELLLERALWNLSLKIARHDYTRADLERELIMAQGEADYLLSLY